MDAAHGAFPAKMNGENGKICFPIIELVRGDDLQCLDKITTFIITL